MEKLCCELDDLALRYCDILEQLTAVKQSMETAMQQVTLLSLLDWYCLFFVEMSYVWKIISSGVQEK